MTPLVEVTKAMKVSGFTVIRNAVLMGYPVLESIQSALPLVDEFVVGIGQSDDQTKELILSLKDPKIRTFDSLWDTKKTQGGLILSEKTNEALEHCQNDWCLYLQADEILHENDFAGIRGALKKAQDHPEVEGLLFRYLHFYGSYHVIATSRRWYRNEVRLVRRSSGIQSVGDAQSFRIHGRKPWVLPANGSVYHYGWVKAPEAMGRKSRMLDRWWHGSKADDKNQNFAYDHQYGLRHFRGPHPAVMRRLIETQNWDYQPERNWRDWKIGDVNLWASDVFEKIFGHRIGEYKSYQVFK